MNSPEKRCVMKTTFLPGRTKITPDGLDALYLKPKLQTMNTKSSHKKSSSVRQERIQYIIDVPKNKDHIEVYVHDGKLPDDKYRHPWKRGKAESYQVLAKECASVFEDGFKFASRDIKRVSDIVPFDSQNDQKDDSLSDAVNFELDFDVVPSSNPCSQDIFTPDEFFETYNEFEEVFDKDNIHQCTSICDAFKIDTVGFIDTTFSDAQQLKPSLSELSSEIESVQVEDPLLLNNKHVMTENIVFRLQSPSQMNDDVPILQKTFDASSFHESYTKIMNEKFGSKDFLEDVITDEYDWSNIKPPCVETANILHSATGPRTHLVIEEGLDLRRLVSKDIVKQQHEDMIQLEHLDYELLHEHASTFLDINEIISTQDRFCEKAMLDVPVLQSPGLMNYHNVNQLLPQIDKVDIEMEEIRLLSGNEKQNLLQAVWESEKYCNEIQACRLPEPKETHHCLEMTETVKQAKEVFGALTSMNTGKSELALSWEIVESINRVTDPCTVLVPYVADSDPINVSLTDLETFDKFSSDDVFGVRLSACFIMDENNDKPPTSKVNKVQSKIKPLSIPCDPLEAFMALRSKAVIRDRSPTAYINSPVSQKDKSDHAPIKKQNRGTSRQTGSRESNRKTKQHTVKIQLSEALYEILELLESASENYLDKLKQCGELSPNTTFLSISPDVSRFMLKQRKKYIEDNKLNGLNDDTLKLIVILHGLVGAADLAVNCCLESAIGYINALQEKYKDILGAVLDPVRQKLFQLRANLYQNNVLHPKVTSLCKEVETWLRNKRAKTKDHEQKILVLIKHDMPSLMSCLKYALSLGNLLTPEVLASSKPESVIASLDQHNCLIVPCRLLSECFPWAQFCLVVEYEYVENSEWQQLCERQHIRHIGLCMQLGPKTDITTTRNEWKLKYPEKQICLIGSTKVTKSTELLQSLEAGQNILLVERDYSQLQGSKHLFFSDIDVDANAGIVLQDLKEFGDDCTVQHLVIKLAAMCLKYVNCWLILCASKKSESYTYPSHVIANIARLQANIANIVHHSPHVSIKVLTCNSFNEVASLIRTICESCMTDERNKPISQWLNRTWLSEEISKEEKFLLMLPCLNSFSAQLLLDKMALRRIFTTSITKLAQLVPEIDVNILKTLQMFVNSSTGLHLREAPSVEYTESDSYSIKANKNMTKLQKGRQQCLTTEHKRVENNDNVASVELKSHYFKTKNSAVHSSDTQNYAVEQIYNQNVQSGRSDCNEIDFTNKQLIDNRQTEQTIGKWMNPDKSQRPDNKTCHSSVVADQTKYSTLDSKKKLFQKIISPEPVTTYEYNHGLPYIVPESLLEREYVKKRMVDLPIERNEFVPSKTRSNTVRDSRKSIRLSGKQNECFSGFKNYASGVNDLEREFTTLEDIKKTASPVTKSIVYCPEHDTVDLEESFESQFGRISPCNHSFMLSQPHPFVEPSRTIEMQGTQPYCLEDDIKGKNAAMTFQTKTPQTVMIPQQTVLPDFLARQDLESVLNASKMTENSDFQQNINHENVDIPVIQTDGKNKKHNSLLGQQIYFNPQIKRLTRKQNLDPTKEGRVNDISSPAHATLADDLRETTRKVLENSQQFSKFESTSKRRPLQNMRIGLAQPLMRVMKKDNTEQVNISAQEQHMMDKSLWTIEDSPPMDLDYENTGINDMLYAQKSQKKQDNYNFGAERANVAVFTSQTPKKKRKLTYQPVAGRNGQTKLVFE